MVASSVHNLFASIGDESTHMQGLLASIAFALGKAVFFSIAVYLLDQAVSLFFFLLSLKHVLTLCHTVGLSEGQLGIKAIVGVFLGNGDTWAAAMCRRQWG